MSRISGAWEDSSLSCKMGKRCPRWRVLLQSTFCASWRQSSCTPSKTQVITSTRRTFNLLLWIVCGQSRNALDTFIFKCVTGKEQDWRDWISPRFEEIVKRLKRLCSTVPHCSTQTKDLAPLSLRMEVAQVHENTSSGLRFRSAIAMFNALQWRKVESVRLQMHKNEWTQPGTWQLNWL